MALVFSFRRHENAGGKIYRQPELNIVMQEDVAQMDEVVVTGIFKSPGELYRGGKHDWKGGDFGLSGAEYVADLAKYRSGVQCRAE